MSTKNKDQFAQAEIRIRATEYYIANIKTTTYKKTAEIFNVGESSVRLWVNVFRKGGASSIELKKRGNTPERKLNISQEKKIINAILDKAPEQLKLPFCLWTRESVGVLINDKFGISLSLSTIGRYLKKWNMTPQKPANRFYEQNSEEVKKWLDRDYPKIARKAKKEGAEIQWCDETGVYSRDQIGRTYSLKGQTPIIKNPSMKYKINMISTVTNRWQLKFMMYKEKFTSEIFISFLNRLLKSTSRKIFIILDNYRVHKSVKVKGWVKKNKTKIALYFLPKYSPELNPDEYLNNDLKQQIKKRPKVKTADDLKVQINSIMKMIQKEKKRVKGYCNTKNTRYANI